MKGTDLDKKAVRRAKRATKIVTAVEAAKASQHPKHTRLKLSHRRHTGRRLPIHSTSYAVLFFILLFVGTFLAIFSQQSVVAGPVSDSGDINVTGIVAGDPPTTPAVIVVPVDGTHFTENIITVSGTCESGLLIEIYRNNAFAGSQMCDLAGEFSLKITIIPGQNTLIARSSDFLGRYAPDSNTVNVYYDPIIPPAPAPVPGGGTVTPAALPFLIYTQPVQRGLFPDQSMTMAYEVDGGVAPYAISIDWGDGSEPTVVALTKQGDFEQTHIYAKPGQYVVSISGTDSQNNKAFVQTIVIVNGPLETDNGTVFIFGMSMCEGDSSIVCRIINSTNLLWPAFLIALIMTISFWAGEQIVLHKYKNIIKNA